MEIHGRFVWNIDIYRDKDRRSCCGLLSGQHVFLLLITQFAGSNIKAHIIADMFR